MSLTIQTYCTIHAGTVKVNDKVVFDGATVETDFLKGLYQFLEMNYPKFFKMDNLSKLGVLGVELLKKEDLSLTNLEDDELGMVFQSEKGCLESDLQHQERVNNQSPSPAVFVYTLANIVIGEISIRNKWFGESIFFIEKESELSALISYSKSLILTGKSSCCLVGVIESFNDQHELVMALITRDNGTGMPFDQANLKKIMSKK